ncbi:MAG: serine hydrolase domain-containing protein [Bacteroidota bacterium]
MKSMKQLVVVFLFLLFYAHSSAQSIESRCQAILDSIFQAHPSSVGIMAHIESPQHGISWSGASGYSDKDAKTPLNAKQPALIASSIKTYIAASILRLVEDKQLRLDQGIANLLTDKSRQLFAEDGYQLDQIQVQHLLSHTSGIKDYADGSYIEFIDQNPKHRWTRDSQLKRTVERGDPLGAPGKQFSYADANYLLLTEIIETTTQQAFYAAMRQLLRYDELGMQDTWFPTLEERPAGALPRVHQYWGKHAWDSYDQDVSWDLYGGGGIACNTENLAKFSYHFFNGDIVKDPSIQKLIFTEIPTKETEMRPYYLGLSESYYHGMNAYGHGGFWGTVVMYFPCLNASISVYVLEKDKNQLRKAVLTAFSQLLKPFHYKTSSQNEQLVKYLDAVNDFSGTVLLAQQDKLLAHRAYGLASIEYQVPNETDTRFHIGSISKGFTAVAALQLVEQGKVDLEQVVGTYLPDYPSALVRDSVQIWQLLTQPPGLPSSDNDPYVILELIVEKASGLHWYDYLDQHIFQRVGMTQTFAAGPDSIFQNKASGYTSLWGKNSHLSRNDPQLSKASPAKSFYASTEDLFRFSKALRSHQLLSKEMTEAMLRPQAKGHNTHLGYGVKIDQRCDQRILGLSGSWFGVRSEWMEFLASGHTLIILSNKDDNGRSGASKLIEDMRDLLGGPQKSTP